MKGRGATLGADENSSPNVMQILLNQGEAGSGEKVRRGARSWRPSLQRGSGGFVGRVLF